MSDTNKCLSKSRLIISQMVFLVVIVSGCVTAPKLTEPIERSRTFDATYDDVWKAAIQALTSSNQIITMSQKDSGVIGVDREFDRTNVWNYVIIDGWTKFWTQWQKFHSRANLVVQSLEPTKTKVVVNVQMNADYLQAQPNYFFGTVSYSNQQHTLTSNGKIEKGYLDMIEAQLPKTRQLAWLDEKAHQTVSGTGEVTKQQLSTPAPDPKSQAQVSPKSEPPVPFQMVQTSGVASVPSTVKLNTDSPNEATSKSDSYQRLVQNQMHYEEREKEARLLATKNQSDAK